MDANGGIPNTTRVELSNGWADVRPTTAGLIRELRNLAHKRGFEDEALDVIDGLPFVIAAWSRDVPVTQEETDKLSEMDAVAIWAAAKGISVPNQSALSSVGGKPPGRERRRQSGPSA